ncbi:BlaI/MecI/CopY family transcriptional regulator [Gemmiger sp. An120]|uniref:BlaI/MecI/CopY family transcriptional regulator n=1 Tax=Gemmiger sp. An120 TaxID=1965549 RepID=UPI000B39D165|nr:BlaI/MecI/CopY family transcriptional regulator [Gemmiger sp. An120]OUQ41303.1 BlaI/MecI/CopY family transcriptional regulator [Gemmiger sp. An120]
MRDGKLGAVESRFADIVWREGPLPSSRLATLAEEELGWKKSTTYTVLKRLCEGGLLQNEKGTVSARMSREEFYAARSEQFVEETFDGSLPAFLAAFSTRKKLSDREIDQLQALIDEMRG